MILISSFAQSDDAISQFSNYDLDHWNNPSVMPVGFAAVATIIVGAVGSVLGMAQLM